MLSNSLIHCVASGNAIFLPIFNLLRRWAPRRRACRPLSSFHSPSVLTSSLLWLAAGRGGKTPPPSELWPDAGTWGSWWPGCPLRTALSSVNGRTNHPQLSAQLSRLTNASFCYVLVLHMGWRAQHLVLSWLKGICVKRCVVLTNRACVQCA